MTDRLRFNLSQHAIDRYRERVIACPERERSDALLGAVMASILVCERTKKTRNHKRTHFAKFKPWGILVLHFDRVVTTLGPGMPETRTKKAPPDIADERGAGVAGTVKQTTDSGL